ncbi:hypothetical protein ZWY2020_051239 [Hordeum vulgare]|nr:hypothetical protein ZWY2020_051239 [Hordeum vulgare]
MTAKRKAQKHEQPASGRKPQEHPLCGGGHGDPLARKRWASFEPDGGSRACFRGSAAAPILAEEEIVLECFKCGRTGHFQAKYSFPVCVICRRTCLRLVSTEDKHLHLGSWAVLSLGRFFYMG